MPRPKKLAKGIMSKVNVKLKFNSKPIKALDVTSYRTATKRSVPGDGLENDHIPSKAALIRAAESKKRDKLTRAERRAIEQRGVTVTVPEKVHADSRTYKGRNTTAQVEADGKDLRGAMEKDLQVLSDNLRARGYDQASIDSTLDAVRRQNRGRGI